MSNKKNKKKPKSFFDMDIYFNSVLDRMYEYQYHLKEKYDLD